MSEITQIGKYVVTNAHPDRPTSFIFEVLDPDTQKLFFCKVLKGLQPGKAAQRSFRDIARKLARLKSPNINAPVDSGFDHKTEYFFIIYPFIDTTPTLKRKSAPDGINTKVELLRILQNWKQLAEALSDSQTLRIFHKDIHPENILFSDKDKPVLIDFGLIGLSKTLSKTGYELSHAVAYTAPELLQKKEGPIEIRADIYSLGLCMLESVIGSNAFHQKENNDLRLEVLGNKLVEISPLYPVQDLLKTFKKSIAENPRERYSKYSNLIVDLANFLEVLLIEKDKPAAIFIKDKPDFNQDLFFQELNEKGATVLIEEEKYQDPGGYNPEPQVRFRLSSDSYYAPRGFVENNTLKLISLHRKADLDTNNRRSYNFIRKNGIKINLNFQKVSTINKNKEEWTDVETLFNHYFDEYADQFSSIKLTKRQKEILDFYYKLLEGELEYLQRNAFKVKYREFKRKGNDIHFSITIPQGKNWQYIHQFIQKSTNPNLEQVELVVAGSKSKRGRPVSIGKAVKFDNKEKILIVRDFQSRIDEIPVRNGELQEDVSRQEVQFTRQIKAIRAFRNGSFVNRELCAYLFNPETLPEDIPLLPELTKVMSKDETGLPVQLYESQDQAVRKILFNDPITLIQGPPGTGKTTLIVEAIRQIITRDPQADILVTSQSNFAVDNVLQKLTQVKLPIIRLGDPQKIKQASVKDFALKKSLKTWAERTLQSHKSSMEKGDKKFKLDSTLNYIYEQLKKSNDWKHETKSIIENAIHRFLNKKQDYSDLLDKMGSYAEFEVAFSEKIAEVSGDPHFYPLKQISNDWERLLNNLDEKSDLVNKMVSSVNIIGATSNHIASGSYTKFDFNFDYVIMDEAARATPSESLVPISMGKKIVLVGDHLQLRPIVTTNKKLLKQVNTDTKEELLENPHQTYLDEDHPSLFEMMFGGAPEDYKEALNIQRRMPAEVSDLISKYFYEPKPHALKILTAEEKKQEKTQIGPIHQPILLFDTGTAHKHQKDRDTFSTYNRHNVEQIIDLLQHLDKIDGIENLSIGVISGYSAQINKINYGFSDAIRKKQFHKLRHSSDSESTEAGVSIATVDSFQGLEKDIIIFDIVRSHPTEHLAFLEIPNRINVALSRVKKLLVIVGDIENTIRAPRMQPDKSNEKAPIQKLIEEIHGSGRTISSWKEVFNEK